MAGPTTDVAAILSSFISAQNWLKPEYYPQLIDRFPSHLRPEFTMMMEMSGRALPSPDATYRWWETDYIHPNVQIASTVTSSAGPGTPVTLQIAVADHNNSGTESYPQDGMLVLVNGKIRARITATDKTTPNAHRITLLPATSVDIGVVADNSYIIVYSNTYAERTGQPQTHEYRVQEFSNQMQIIKKTMNISGSGLTDGLWWKWGDKEGYISYAEMATYLEYKMYQEGAVLWGANITNGSAPDTATATVGLLDAIENQGGIYHTYSIGSLDVPRWDSLADKIKKNHGAKEYILYNGLLQSQEITNFIDTTWTNGSQVMVSSASFNGDGKAAFALGYSSFKKDGFNYVFKPYDYFDDVNIGATPGYNWQNYGFGIPMDLKRDARTGNAIPSCCIRYKKLNGYSRQNETFMLGSANVPVATTDIDEHTVNYRCEMGFQWFGINRYFALEGL